MTIKQRIDKFVKKYPEPYQFKIELRWDRKDGTHSKTYFPKNSSGSKKYWGREDYFITRTGRDFIAQHYRYDEKLGLLELAYAVFDCHVPKEGENRRWTYGYRYFIPKDTRELYDINGKQGTYHYARTSYHGWAYNRPGFAQQFAAMPYSRNMFPSVFLEFAGDNLQTSSSWRSYMTTESYPWQLQYWFEYVPKQKTTGKMQKLIDELSTTELEISDDVREKIISNMNSDRYIKKSAWFDLDHKVFRCFTESSDGIFEDKRVYIADKGKYAVATINPQGEWVTNRSFTNRQFDFHIVNMNDVCKLPYCDYLNTLVGDGTPTVYRVVSAMKNPEIEQLFNMGLLNIAKHIFKQDQIKSSMKEVFGEPNKKKGVLAKYNLNKKQAEYVNSKFDTSSPYSYRYSSISGIARIKTYMHIDNIAALDYETFVKYYNFASNLDWIQRRNLDRIPSDVRQKVVAKLCNMSDRHSNAVGLFSDTYNAYYSLNRDNRPNIDLYALKSYEELVRLHNTCVELQEIERAERRRLYNMEEAKRHAELEKKMAKLDEERRKFNYSDADFTIRLPEKLSEIVNEGSVLRHCVGGYTQNHAQGHTTIMFLRKNSDPTIPFYTIEIRNDNTIQQIHGSCNCWLGNNPEAIPTVMRWLRANNLYCKDEILLSTAKGYHAGNATLVEKPII